MKETQSSEGLGADWTSGEAIRDGSFSSSTGSIGLSSYGGSAGEGLFTGSSYCYKGVSFDYASSTIDTLCLVMFN